MNPDNYNNEIYEDYKQLRNHLRKLFIDDALYVLWAYSVFMQFNNKKMPTDIELPPSFDGTRDSLFFKCYLNPWEIFTLTKEVIINSSTLNYENKTFKKYNYFADGVNKLKNFEESISKKYITSENVLRELGRISHRQFIWQSHYPHTDLLFRYFKIFSEPKLDSIVENIFDISSKKICILGLAMIGGFLNNMYKKNPPSMEISKSITSSDLEKFLNHFSLDLEQLKQKLVNEQKYSEKYAYSFNSLFAYPIIKMNFRGSNCLICPNPTILYWRFTSGIYYEIYNHPNFSQIFGDAFQNYIGSVLKRNIKKFEILPEELYRVGKLKKQSTDWIINGDALLFLECKTKRITQEAKEELITEDYINRDVGILADAAVQIYKKVIDFKSGYYKNLNFSDNKKKRIFPLIVTLEDWFLFGDDLVKRLETLTKEKLKQNNLNTSLWDEMPISVCCVEELEKFTQLFDVLGIEKFMAEKVFDSDKKNWLFSNYPNTCFPEESKKIRSLYKGQLLKALGIEK
jgi:hypothetical protein